jgi:uncharacterized protein DUF3352
MPARFGPRRELPEDDAAMNDTPSDAESGSEGARLPEFPVPAAPTAPADLGSPRRPTSSRGRRTLIIFGGVLAAVLVLGGVGLGAVMYALRGSGERLSTTTPADVDFFATAYLDPSAGQKLNLARLLRRFPASASSDRIDDPLDSVLDGVLADAGLSAADIRSWLGSQVAVTGRLSDTGASLGVLLDSDDDDAALATLAELRSHDIQGRHYAWSSVQRDGTTIWLGGPETGGTPVVLAVTDGTVLLANSLQLASDVASTASGATASLEESAHFQRAIASLPEDRLALGYVNVGSMMGGLGPGFSSGVGSPVTGGGLLGVPDVGAVDALALSVEAEPEGLRVDMATTLDPTKLTPEMRSALESDGDAGASNQTLSWVPSDAYGVIAMSGLREQIEAGLARAGLDGALPLDRLGLTGPDGVVANLTGDASIEVSPGAGRYPTGALVLGTTDAGGMRAILDRISGEVVGAIASSSAPAPAWASTTYRGVEIRSLDISGDQASSVRPSYAVVDGVAILAASPEAIRASLDAHEGESIASEGTFRAAVAAIDGVDRQLLYVDVDGVGRAIREALPPEERSAFDLEVAPSLEPIDAFVAGTRTTTAGSTTRMMLLIR